MASSSGPAGSPQPGQAGSDPDLALAEALIAGKREAFEPFVDRFAPLILNFGRRMCGQRDDADEVLQETLLKAFQSVKDLREPAALKSWVYRVAANACLKMRRRGKFEPKNQLSLDEVLPQPRGDGRPPEIPDWSEIPLDRLLQGELKEKIDEAIQLLPKQFRIVLVLRDQEGFSTREAAEVLGITETLAKVRLHRARLALRKRLEGYVAQTSERPAAMRGEPMPHPPGKMTCREMAEYLSDYIDGDLDASMRRLIDEHGGECPPCRAFVRTLARTVEAVRAQPRQPLPSALRKTLAGALRKASA